MSSSMRRTWIEIKKMIRLHVVALVVLHAEDVD